MGMRKGRCRDGHGIDHDHNPGCPPYLYRHCHQTNQNADTATFPPSFHPPQSGTPPSSSLSKRLLLMNRERGVCANYGHMRTIYNVLAPAGKAHMRGMSHVSKAGR